MAVGNELRRRNEWLSGRMGEEPGEVDESQGDCWLGTVEDFATAIADGPGSRKPIGINWAGRT